MEGRDEYKAGVGERLGSSTVRGRYAALNKVKSKARKQTLWAEHRTVGLVPSRTQLGLTAWFLDFLGHYVGGFVSRRGGLPLLCADVFTVPRAAWLRGGTHQYTNCKYNVMQKRMVVAITIQD